MPRVFVHLLPTLVEPQTLRDQVVVVVDVLRATTTIAHALAAGARAVVPCLEIEEARQRAANLPAGSAVLGGERQGLRIEGFDLGNSPTEYTPERVAGKTVVFTTTNGTRAMLHARSARRVLLGSLVNLDAVAESLAAAPQVHILCAGTRGEITGEDTLFAGALAELLLGSTAWDDTANQSGNDEATLALSFWRSSRLPGPGTRVPSPRQLVTILRHTQGGRNLLREGFADDIATASQINSLDIVPELDLERWEITASHHNPKR